MKETFTEKFEKTFIYLKLINRDFKRNSINTITKAIRIIKFNNKDVIFIND